MKNPFIPLHPLYFHQTWSDRIIPIKSTRFFGNAQESQTVKTYGLAINW